MRMKRIITLAFFCCLFTLPALAQKTYFYHCSKHIYNDVISKNDKSVYLTFSGNSLYESDRYGNFTGRSVYKYYGTKDGNRYYYMWTEPAYYGSSIYSGYHKDFGYIVSSDYSVVNYFILLQGYVSTDVYYRTTEEALKKEKSDQIPGLIY